MRFEIINGQLLKPFSPKISAGWPRSAEAKRGGAALQRSTPARFLCVRRSLPGWGGADDPKAILQAVRKPFAPRQMVFLVDSKVSRQRLEALMPYVKDIVPVEKRAVVTVCEKRLCRTATTEVARILAQ